jgi:hypothetical protein
VDGDGVLLEELRDGLDGRRTEDAERLLLGGDQDELRLVLRRPPGGHQGQLVDRERPHDTVRNDEPEGSDVAGIDLVQEAPEHLDVRAPGERLGARNCRDEPGAARDDQRVVLRLRAVVEEGPVPGTVHPGEPGDSQLGSDVTGDRTEIQHVDVPVAERLRDRERPVCECRLGRHELDRDQIGRERVQRESRLDAGHAPTGDDNAQRHFRSIRFVAFACIRELPRMAPRETRNPRGRHSVPTPMRTHRRGREFRSERR